MDIKLVFNYYLALNITTVFYNNEIIFSALNQ